MLTGGWLYVVALVASFVIATVATPAGVSGAVLLTMLITLVLVVMVIFAFLHSGSATLIPALALPFSIFGTFAVMEVLDFTLDNLSMMALILSIGFVVDDAIVMLENIVRHMETGRRRSRRRSPAPRRSVSRSCR